MQNFISSTADSDSMNSVKYFRASWLFKTSSNVFMNPHDLPTWPVDQTNSSLTKKIIFFYLPKLSKPWQFFWKICFGKSFNDSSEDFPNKPDSLLLLTLFSIAPFWFFDVGSRSKNAISSMENHLDIWRSLGLCCWMCWLEMDKTTRYFITSLCSMHWVVCCCTYTKSCQVFLRYSFELMMHDNARTFLSVALHGTKIGHPLSYKDMEEQNLFSLTQKVNL